jgi:hypothetical protein
LQKSRELGLKIEFSHILAFMTSFHQTAEKQVYIYGFNDGKNELSCFNLFRKIEKCIQNTQNAFVIHRRNIQYGIVYFIHEVNKFNRFKIGFTTNVSRRINRECLCRKRT